MLKKEFKRKDVERMRNIIQGRAGDSSEQQIGYTKKRIERKEGDIWKEGHKTWTIKNGIKQTVSKLDKLCDPYIAQARKDKVEVLEIEFLKNENTFDEKDWEELYKISEENFIQIIPFFTW